MQREEKGKALIDTFDSMAEFADIAIRDGRNKPYAGTLRLVRDGWDTHVTEALDIAEHAIEAAYTLNEHKNFVPVWDVAGAEVDVGAYLAGEPECMIDYPIKSTYSFGRTITLVSSSDGNAGVGGTGFEARGKLAVALAMAINTLGYAVEIWTDNFGSSSWGYEQYQRVMVKSTSDTIDPAHLMYAFGHYSVLRELAFATFDGYPGQWRRSFSTSGRGSALDHRGGYVADLYPPGTIFIIGGVDSNTPEAMAEYVLNELRKLGILDG